MDSKQHLRVGSFFAGCGGLDFGLKNAGFDLVWANELEQSYSSSYKSLCASHCHTGDFWETHKELPDVDVIVGGPPCQSFSLVGKRLHDDPRGKLISGFVNLILERRPKGFIIENVAGLSASKIDGERLPEYISGRFREAGYQVLYEKFDASEYLVPQRRKRIIIAGVRDPKSSFQAISQRDFIDHLKNRSGLSFSEGKVSASEALSDLDEPSESRKIVKYRMGPQNAFQKLMRDQGLDKVDLHFMPTMSTLDREFVKHIPPGGNYSSIPEEISTVRIKKFKASGGRTTTYGRLHPDHPAFTINTYFNRPNVGANYHYSQERLITVREAMRLQSFPDSFSPTYRTLRELHAQIGNAVPPLLAEAIGISLRKAIDGK